TSVEFIINNFKSDYFSNMDESENYGMYTEVDNNYLIIDKIIEECKIDIHYLNEFTNYEKIGEGGYGWVEKAEWKTRESTVASKSLKVKKSSNEILARKFARELSNEPIQLFATEVSQSVHATPFLSKTYNYHKAKSLNKQLDFQNLSKLDTFDDGPHLKSDTIYSSSYINESNKNNNLLNSLLRVFFDLTNHGNMLPQISKMIIKIIEDSNQAPKNVFINLNKNSNLNSDLKCLLGFFYLTGIGTVTYSNTAFRLFEKIAHENNAMGKFYLGECFMHGYGTRKDLEKAIEWHQEASIGCAKSNDILGLCYMKGDGVKKDIQIAYNFFKKSYEMGCISACNNLGNCYEHGIIVGKNEVKAFEHYRKAADYDISLGQFNLARCYEEGIGVIKNLKLAIYWYQKAANNEHKNAINQLNNLVPVRKKTFINFLR
ncbi:21527_t:CDS:2, partial [Gigaspora rosea]